MRGILIFDHLNDVLFTKCNKKFASHIQKLAKQQGLLPESKDENEASDFKPSPNIIMQLFSPIVTSQHVMASQFGNTYTAMKCQDGTNMVFDEYMGYTFMYISNEDVELLRRTVGVCVTIVRHLCGPDVSILKLSRKRVKLVSSLIDAWSELRNTEQNILTEAVEQLTVNAELASATLKILSDAADKLKTQPEFANVHVLVLVENKFMSLFSSRNVQDLLASDILLMILLCHVANKSKQETDAVEKNRKNESILLSKNTEESNENEEEKKSRVNQGRLSVPTLADITLLFEGSRESSVCEDLSSYANNGLYSQVVLLGSETNGYTANAIHISELAESINLVTVIEITSPVISSGLYNSFYHLNVINGLQLQRDIDELRPAFDNLDAAMKKTFDGLKKNRGNVSNSIDMCQRRLQAKWEFFRKKYLELLKTRDLDAILQIESNTSSFVDALKELFRLTCLDRSFLKQGIDLIMTVSRLVSQKLNDFSDFLKVKALKNFSIGSYLEEFPGLVHFIYIDRNTHRLTAPSINFTNSETLELTKKKIWTMVEQSRVHLQEGHISVMWKDTTFNYAYFLWFEDTSASPLKCKTYFNHAMKNFPVPGILCGDYYRKLAEAFFPKISLNKIRIYELYCVHLGLATSSCVLEHSRRIAATIWELTGLPNNPADIL